MRSKVEQLEAAVAGLKRRATHDEALHKADHMRLLQARSLRYQAGAFLLVVRSGLDFIIW